MPIFIGDVHGCFDEYHELIKQYKNTIQVGRRTTMSYFLSDKRRAKLVTDLIEINMPKRIAQKMADLKDDIAELDIHLAAFTNQMMHYAKQVKAYEKDNTAEIDVPFDVLLVFIAADQIIIDAYKDEAQERNITKFPLWTECMIEHIAFIQKNSGVLPN